MKAIAEKIGQAVGTLKANPRAEVDERDITSVTSSRPVIFDEGPIVPFLYTSVIVMSNVETLGQCYEEYDPHGHPQRRVDAHLYLWARETAHPRLDTHISLQSKYQEVNLTLSEEGEIKELRMPKAGRIKFEGDVVDLEGLRVKLSKPEEMAARMAVGNPAVEIVP